MIQLTSRREALKDCPVLAQYIHYWQQAEYEDLLDSETPEAIAVFQAGMDSIEIDQFDAPPYSLIFNKEADNIYDYAHELSEAVFEIANACKWEQLHFLLLYNKPWQLQQNNYPPVAKEQKYLGSIGIKDDYAGAISVSGVDISKIVRSVFWLGRCNASLPYIYFSAPNSDAVLSICKYGFLHIDAYNENELIRIRTVCEDAALHAFNGQTFDFLEGGVLMGRTT